MSKGIERQLKAALFESVRSQVAIYGFALNTTKDSFIRWHDGAADIFQLVCLDAKPGLRIQPNVAVRFDRIEDLFHKTSGFEAKYQRDTPTIGGSVGNILSDSNRACEFTLESDSDVESVTEQIVRTFREFALPYFERYGSLRAIDAELNNNPTQRTPNRVMPWLRCSTGVIVAKLLGRPDYDHLAAIYTELMSRVDKGFYLKRFQALLESLEAIEQGNGLAR